jgi:integrase
LPCGGRLRRRFNLRYRKLSNRLISNTVRPIRPCFPLRELHAAAKPQSSTRELRRATAALGLKITPHNLRDTAASLVIQAGASVVAVARPRGHESAATTLNHHAGHLPTDLDDVAVRLDAAAREAIGD